MTLYNTSYAMLQFSSIWNESTAINYLYTLICRTLVTRRRRKGSKRLIIKIINGIKCIFYVDSVYSCFWMYVKLLGSEISWQTRRMKFFVGKVFYPNFGGNKIFKCLLQIKPLLMLRFCHTEYHAGPATRQKSLTLPSFLGRYPLNKI